MFSLNVSGKSSSMRMVKQTLKTILKYVKAIFEADPNKNVFLTEPCGKQMSDESIEILQRLKIDHWKLVFLRLGTCNVTIILINSAVNVSVLTYLRLLSMSFFSETSTQKRCFLAHFQPDFIF